MPMYTVKSVIKQMISPEVVFRRVSETLRELDPLFALEEEKYLLAEEMLEIEIGDSVSPSAREFIDAKKRKICAELVYVVWLGFQQNLECFQNPINALFLNADYEDLHRERRMHTLPEVNEAQQTIDAFYAALKKLPQECRELTNGITEYVCYLETIGYKLAHYFGYNLGNSLFKHLIPGYVPDDVLTGRYKSELTQCLQFDISQI